MDNDREERINQTGSLETVFSELVDNEPKIVKNFVPSNLADEKRRFLSEEGSLPSHEYSSVDGIDFDSYFTKLNNLGEAILIRDDIDAKDRSLYESFIESYQKKAKLLQLSKQVRNDNSPQHNEDFMRLNIEIYHEPDHEIYRSLLSEKLNNLRTKDFVGVNSKIYNELIAILPRNETELTASRFRPSQETVEWAHEIVTALYGNFLSHVPEDQETFEDHEIRSIMQKIIDEEFTDEKTGISAAEGWSVVIEPVVSISVRPADKQVVIPEGKKLSNSLLRKRIVHEIGVHLFRSVMGEQTTLMPLQYGLDESYDSEEGLGALVEQALEKEYKDSGVDHYISAGLAYFDDKDFRQIYEIKWRLAVLEKAKDGIEVSDVSLEKTKALAYGSVLRCFRGTDTLPLFKDLSYYNGVSKSWKYLEDNIGDDFAISLLLLGKADPTNLLHKNILLETRTL